MLKKIIGIVAIFLGGLLVFAIFSGFFNQFISNNLFSPISENSEFHFFTQLHSVPKKTNTKKIVLGFLPYWNLDDVTFQPELTQLAFFSLTIEKDGSIRTKEGTASEPGYRTFNSSEFQNTIAQWENQQKSPKLILVISQFENETIESFLNNNSAQDKFLTTLDSLINAYPVGGLNIDFEPTGVISTTTRDNFSSFIKKLKTHTQKKYNNFEISVDVYASAISRPNLWDVPKIAQDLDSIVIMAYDFHRRSSPASGPVAPLFGGQESWEHDISLYLSDYISQIDRKKILLGVPFYGYEWQTTSTEAQSATYPNTGHTASYKYVQDLLINPQIINLQRWWNDSALSPYLTYEENGKIYTIYYDDARSLSYKLELVKQLDLGGIAIWALGYEGNNRDLWEVINSQLVD